MKVKVIAAFRDRTDDLKLRKAGTVLEVSEERANKLRGMGLVKVIQEPEQQTEPAKKTRSKTKRTGTQ